MPSPLFEYTQQQKERHTGMEDAIHAKQIGLEFAKEQLAMGEEAQRRGQKLEMLLGLYQNTKDPKERLRLLKDIGPQMSMDTAGLEDIEEEAARDLDIYLGQLKGLKPGQEQIAQEGLRQLHTKHPGRFVGLPGPAAPSVTVTSPSVGSVQVSPEDALGYAGKVDVAALAAGRGGSAEESKLFDDARATVSTVMDRWKSGLPAQAQLMLTAMDFMNMSAADEGLIMSIRERMNKQIQAGNKDALEDRKALDAAMGIIRQRVGGGAGGAGRSALDELLETIEE